MNTNTNPAFETLRQHQISGHVEIATGNGGLPLVKIKTPWSTAEIYPHGAHVSSFQKNGEPPLIFMSRKSWFANGQPIRGGVPICFPWFGPREGEPAHGFVRLVAWELVKASANNEGVVTLVFALPEIPGRKAWNALRTEFVVTVGETLAMELIATNESCGETFEIENCLHTYFHVSDISAVALDGLQGAPFNDFARGANGASLPASHDVLRITEETNRVYPNHTGTMKICDEKFKRIISVVKFNSQSTVVWNPWTTQKLPDDFDPAEHAQMVCVESGNVKQNKLALGAGKAAALKVVLSSAALE